LEQRDDPVQHCCLRQRRQLGRRKLTNLSGVDDKYETAIVSC